MTVTTVNLSRPGQAPQNGDFIRITITRADGSVVSIVEKEYRAAVV